MPDPATITITYVYGTQTYETTVLAGSKVVLEREPFYFLGQKITRYVSDESPSQKYHPGQLITSPNYNLTLTVDALANINHVNVYPDSSSTHTDISNIVLNIKEKCGKNQPFTYAIITVLKERFNELNFNLVQKVSRFATNVYGIQGSWLYERLEDNGSTYDITVVNRAYYLKTTTILSLFNFTIINQGATIRLSNLDIQSNITWDSNESGNSNTEYGTFTITVHPQISMDVPLTITIKRVNSATDSDSDPEYTYSLIKLEGTPDNIFKFLAYKVANLTSFTVVSGQYYDLNPPNLYTSAQIEALTPTTITNEAVFDSVALRLDQFCWDVIESIALLTGRYAFFTHNYAYLIPFTVFPSNAKKLVIDWEEPSDLEADEEYVPILALSSNEDQGSQYVMSSQKVICEAYETTVAISDTASTDVGEDIVFASPDNTPLISGNDDPNAVRNQQARIIALNSIKRRFKPGDCIRYSVCLATNPSTDNIVNDLSNVPNPTSQNAYLKYVKMLDEDSGIEEYSVYFKSQSNLNVSGQYVWVEYDTDDPIKGTSATETSPRRCVPSIEDRQNGITLLNAPVALIETEYPSCITTYTWGMPEFMDEQSQFSELTAVAQDTVLDNTSDTQISSCDASKIVVGNQSISELQHDRKGFTGLIMEKNVDNQVYRLVGYNQGEVQAEFNSQGEIQSGAGNVVINQEGITLNGGVDIILPSDGSRIIAQNVVLDSSGLNAYTNVNPAIEDPQQWGTNTLSIGASGNIEAGLGAVQIGVIGSNNLVTKNGSTVQCYISNTGELMAGAGAVKLNSSGMGIYNGSTLQTQINTSGDIVAGGTIVLNGNGLIGYYNTPISTATRSIYISKTGSIAIGGNGGRTLQISGGQIKFFADGSAINSDGTVTGTAGAYITDAGMVTGLAEGSVSTAQIVAEAVTNAKMALNSVDTAQIVDSAIKEAKLNDNAVTTNKINSLAVTTAKIDNSAITNAKIANASISTAKIQNAAITTALIDNLAVTNAKIDGLAVGKIETGTLSADCNIILANTGSELLAGPYTPLTIVSIPSSTPSSGPIVQAAKMGAYILFEQQDDFVIESVTSSSGPSISWLTQQGASSYGGIPPVTESMTAYYVTFKFKNANNIEVTINYTVFAILSTDGEKAYRVRLNKDGLFTYDNTGTQVCSVGADGNITGVRVTANHIDTGTLSASTITIGNNGKIKAGGVELDSTGLKTYDTNNNLQTSIGTDGKIVAGGGAVTLDNSGLTVTDKANITLGSNSSITAGGALFNSNGITINYTGGSYDPAYALKFYDTTNQWSPYKLYATYDSSGATSIVKAESKTIGTTIPSKLKMVVDGGGSYGKYTVYTTNSASRTPLLEYSTFTTTTDYLWLWIYNNNTYTEVTPQNKDSLGIIPGTTEAYQSNLNIDYDYTDSIIKRVYNGADWTGTYADSRPTTHVISIASNTYTEIRVRLIEDAQPQSVSITTPSSPTYVDCAFIAYLDDGRTFTFKKYSDNGLSSQETQYVFTTVTSWVKYIGIRVYNASSSFNFYLDAYPINIYRTSGDGTSISMDQEGSTIQGNNTINGQLYQSGGPIYLKGAGPTVPAYFDMPIVPQAVISQGGISGASVVTRGGAQLTTPACRNIYIASEGSSIPPGSFVTGDIILFYQ